MPRYVQVKIGRECECETPVAIRIDYPSKSDRCFREPSAPPSSHHPANQREFTLPVPPWKLDRGYCECPKPLEPPAPPTVQPKPSRMPNGNQSYKPRKLDFDDDDDDTPVVNPQTPTRASVVIPENNDRTIPTNASPAKSRAQNDKPVRFLYEIFDDIISPAKPEIKPHKLSPSIKNK